MKKEFLQFMGEVLKCDCPFNTFSVSTFKTFISVTFDSSTPITPDQLGWINTHLVGGRWWITALDDTVKLIIRFDKAEVE